MFFSTDYATFESDGGTIVCLLGIKMTEIGQTSRWGFPAASNDKASPVLEKLHQQDSGCGLSKEGKPVFLSLRAPQNAISSDTVAQAFNDTTKRAGWDSKHQLLPLWQLTMTLIQKS